MSYLQQTYTALEQLENNNQIISYWYKRDAYILNRLVNCLHHETEYAIGILQLLTTAFNSKEKYATVHYLYLQGYTPIVHLLPSGAALNNLKLQLAIGLHHQHKYNNANTLFNELENAGVNLNEYSEYQMQSAIVSMRTNTPKPSILLSIGNLLFVLAITMFVIYQQASVPSIVISITILLATTAISTYYSEKRYINNLEITPEATTKLQQKIIPRIVAKTLTDVLYIAALYFAQHNQYYQLGITIVYIIVIGVIDNSISSKNIYKLLKEKQHKQK